MGQFSVKTYNPPGSLLSATQQIGVKDGSHQAAAKRSLFGSVH